MSNPESKQYNTIFMGPLTHRETRLDAYLNAKKDVRWSEEAENEYMENVKARAAEKVRALLLQAKRRSDEIIHQAEQEAREITAKAEQNGKVIEQEAQNTLAKAEQRYHDTYHEAVQKAHEEIQQILSQNQQALGESTAIVLLSIHEQVAKFYEAWKEDLKQLTLDAIEVGTGWIASTEKEAILKQLLDESVQKLLDRKNFIVRVNPADAELITQVLENSRVKGWSMESSKELEPGSLELESDNVYVKNSRAERQKFVKEILDNLTLPHTADEERLTEQVKETLNREMQNNPVLSHAVNQSNGEQPEPLDVIPIEKIMPETEDGLPNAVPQMHEPKSFAPEEEQQQAYSEAPNIPADVFDGLLQEPLMPSDSAEPGIQESLPNSGMPFGQVPDPLQSEILQAAEQVQEHSAQNAFDSDDMFEALQATLQQTQNQTMPDFDGTPKTAEPAAAEPVISEPAEPVIEELPSFSASNENVQADLQAPQERQKKHAEQAHAEAQDMVEEFLGTPKPDDTALPSDIADDLLAEMGFNQK